MSFEHGSDVVSAQMMLKHTLEGNVAITQLIPTKMKCIIEIYPC